jgi:hypothetical protein
VHIPAPGPPQRPTNSYAIVALVCSLIVAPIGIVFGHLALGQIRRTGEGGRGLAIAGLVIGYLATTLAVVALVSVAVGLSVFRVHTVVRPQPPQSHSAETTTESTIPPHGPHVTYEVFGSPGATAEISYFDVNAEPQHVAAATLPWSLTLTPQQPLSVGNLVAQGKGDVLGCRITVDNVVKAEHTSREPNASTFCTYTGS